MKQISIGELQKNISFITNIDSAIIVTDKRKNRDVAIIYPIKQNSIVDKLAGKYANKAKDINLEDAKEFALKEAFGQKYGLSN